MQATPLMKGAALGAAAGLVSAGLGELAYNYPQSDHDNTVTGLTWAGAGVGTAVSLIASCTKFGAQGQIVTRNAETGARLLGFGLALPVGVLAAQAMSNVLDHANAPSVGISNRS